MREGKGDIAGNTVVGAGPLALADPSLGSLIAWLIPLIPTLLAEAPSVTAIPWCSRASTEVD